MRNISSSALAKLSEQYAIEPMMFVRIFWSDNLYNDYGDKDKPEDNIRGKILSISGIDDVISISGATSSTSISIKLDDADGELKNIINSKDIHKLRAQVFQWFEGLPKSEAFVIIDGEINTPIVWSEGQRTLDFTIITPLENREFGFSAEEAQLDFLPDSVAGRAWPVVFGTVPQVPSLMILEPPSIVLASGFATFYEAVWQDEILQLQKKIAEAAQKVADAYERGVNEAEIAATYNNDFDPPDGFLDAPPDDYNTYLQHLAASQSYYQQSNDFLLEKLNLIQELNVLLFDYNEKKAFAYTQVPVFSPNVPQGVNLTAEIDGRQFVIQVNGNVMTIVQELEDKDIPVFTYLGEIETRTVSTRYKSIRAKEKFRWHQGGTRIKILSLPVKYIAALGRALILTVYAEHQGLKVKLAEPNYTIDYEEFTNETGQNIFATVITIPSPLSSRTDIDGNNLYDGDVLCCDVQGEVNGTFVDIVSWTVQNFTNLTADVASWDHVKTLTLPIPMNFCVLNRPSALDFIKSLAYQAKTAIWINERTIFMRYLPERPTPVDTIGVDDILEDTLEIMASESEQLVTKMIGTWRFLIRQENANLTTYRNNIARYGLHVEQTDFFAFNNVECVKWAMRYWMVRKSNTFKRIKFRTLIHKLKLETFDAITIDLVGVVSNAPVVGIIEKAVYNSDTNEIEMEVWVPVLFGEMDEFIFGYPKNVTDKYPFNTGDTWSGNPFSGSTSQMFKFSKLPFLGVKRGGRWVNNQNIEEFNPDNENLDIVSVLVNAPTFNPITPDTMKSVNEYNIYNLNDIKQYQFPEADTRVVSLASVVSHIGGKFYKVKLRGNNKVVKCEQIQIDVDGLIANGTVVYAIRTAEGIYEMQAPVWLKDNTSGGDDFGGGDFDQSGGEDVT